MRLTFSVAILLSTFATRGFACSCSGTERPCESLQVEAVFVGRVTDLQSVRRPFKEGSYTAGYTMRFAVMESLHGALDKEVSVETGSGGGDCGTPIPVGEEVLIFAYRDKDGKLWTGLCSGNINIHAADANKYLNEIRRLAKIPTGSVFGKIVQSKPVWKDNDIDSSQSKGLGGMTVKANSPGFTTATKTGRNGAFEFIELPPGTYTIVPEIGPDRDYDREFSERYQATVGDGSCKSVSFQLLPQTKIRGHISFPPGAGQGLTEIVALPVALRNVNQFSGTYDFVDDGSFNIWPLPPGDYYVGVNINSSPTKASPFPPTYYPGVTDQKAASIVHVKAGEAKELEFALPEIAKPRTIQVSAIGLDGKPMKTVYVQIEDLRHRGDAFTYENVNLDAEGNGAMTVFEGFTYHLHASHFVSNGKYWCAKPVSIPAGASPMEIEFVMDHSAGLCFIDDIDGLKK